MLTCPGAVPRGLGWGCQGSGYTRPLLPFPLGTSRPPRGFSRCLLLSPCLCLLGMPQVAQGCEQPLLSLQESWAVPAQQLPEGCGSLQGGLYRLVLQGAVNSCFGARWAQRCVQCCEGSGQQQGQSWGWVGTYLEGPSGPQLCSASTHPSTKAAKHRPCSSPRPNTAAPKFISPREMQVLLSS